MDGIRARLVSGMTGAIWQRRALAAHETGSSRPEALRAMLHDYMSHAATGRPVAEWGTP
jgi:hypothetical protein